MLEEINLSEVMLHLIHEISSSVPVFSHIDVRNVTVSIASGRNGRGGICGRVVPLRFQGGHPVIRHGDRFYRMPEVVRDGVPQLYIIYFYMPRFFDRDAREKLRIIFHELYHISPLFNGDIRRMADKKAAHGHSREAFDRQFQAECEFFYNRIESSPYMKFLSLDSRGLIGTFRKIRSVRMKLPKPVVIEPRERESSGFVNASPR